MLSNGSDYKEYINGAELLGSISSVIRTIKNRKIVVINVCYSDDEKGVKQYEEIKRLAGLSSEYTNEEYKIYYKGEFFERYTVTNFDLVFSMRCNSIVIYKIILTLV